jgi:hypothetical protein
MTISLISYFLKEIVSSIFFVLCLVLLFFLKILVSTRKNHEKWNRGWLSELIDKKVAQSRTNVKKELKSNHSISYLLRFLKLNFIE